MLDQILDTAFLDSVVRAIVPILLAAIGGVLAERAGVWQISIEGTILAGAFGAIAGSYWASSWVVGVLFAAVAGTFVSLSLAFGVISRRSDPIVLGIALNLLAVGVTSFLLFQIFGARGTFTDDRIDGLPDWEIPGLSRTPVLGEIFFSATPLAFLAFVSVPLTWFFLFRTPTGLRLRGVGEQPGAAATLGVNTHRYQYCAVLVSGALGGMAGAQLSLGNVVLFAENMSAGRGWVAVVAVMLGRAHPFAVLGAVGLFGFSDALGFRLQGNGLPVQITDALPFVATLIALVVFRRRFARLLDLSVSTAHE